MTAAQDQFAAAIAHNTGLDVRVVRAWVAQESGYQGKGAGRYNYLNVRVGSGRKTGYAGEPLAGTTTGGFASFRSLGDAVKETSYWIMRMPNYRGIRNSAGKPPTAQIGAIAASPWDAAHYGGGRNLLNTYFHQGLSKGDSLSGIGSAIGHPGRTAGNVAGAVTGAAGDVAGVVLKGMAELVVTGVLLLLFAALLYQGIRRMTGDMLPSSTALVGAAARVPV